MDEQDPRVPSSRCANIIAAVAHRCAMGHDVESDAADHQIQLDIGNSLVDSRQKRYLVT